MGRELVHKRLKLGTLVQLNRTHEYGIVVRVKINWDSKLDSPFCYGVLVRDEEVSANGGDLTVIGDN